MNFLEFQAYAKATGLITEDDEGPLTGARVRLKPLDGVAETGEIVGHDLPSGTCIIKVDDEYIEDGDDGLREFDPEEWIDEVLVVPGAS